MFLKKLMLGISMSLTLSAMASAELAVIVHPSNASTLDKKAVQKIFLGKDNKFSNGTAASPINLGTDNPTRGNFDESIVGRSSSQVAAYWSKLVFTGKGVPPKEVSTDAEVIALVSASEQAIGYVDASSINDSVKVVPLN